jgi:hypothetical protein
MKFAAILILIGLPIHAKKKEAGVPCQRVFVTGSQAHEIAWALKGEGLKNNLYRTTCMQPVANASDADAILDVEPDPRLEGPLMDKRLMARENSIASGDFWVSCNSTSSGSYCRDSMGYALETSCNERGCSSYYGPDISATIGDIVSILLQAWAVKVDAWAYLFSAKDHKLIWKYEGDGRRNWHGTLTDDSGCPKRTGTSGHACKAPTQFLTGGIAERARKVPGHITGLLGSVNWARE